MSHMLRFSATAGLFLTGTLTLFAQTTRSPGEITVQLIQGLDSERDPRGTSLGKVIKSSDFAIPIGSQAVVKIASDATRGGFTTKLVQINTGKGPEPAESSNVVAAPDFLIKMQERARQPGAPQDAVSGTRVFLPGRMIVRFTVEGEKIAATATTPPSDPAVPPAAAATARLNTGSHPTTVAKLQLGMSEQQVRGALGPEFFEVLRRNHVPVPDEAYDSALMLRPGGKWEGGAQENYMLQYVNNRLIYIEHDQEFGGDTRPNFAETRQALIGKWGPTTVPSLANETYPSFKWEWTTGQAPVQDEFQCGFSESMNQIRPNSILHVPMTTPKAAKPGCGLGVYAEIVPDGERQVVNRLAIKMLDQQALLRSQEHEKLRLEKEEKDRVEKSKSNVAPI